MQDNLPKMGMIKMGMGTNDGSLSGVVGRTGGRRTGRTVHEQSCTGIINAIRRVRMLGQGPCDAGRPLDSIRIIRGDMQRNRYGHSNRKNACVP